MITEGPVKCFDLRRAYADISHVALLVTNDDPVSDFDGPLNEQDQA